MAKYDYIKLRVNAEERSHLEAMVAAGEVSSLSDAVRKLAFEQNSEDREILAQYLREVAGAHQTLTLLIRNGGIKGTALSRLADTYKDAGAENSDLEELAGRVVALEADVFAMEREVQALVASAAELSREIRRVM